MVKVRLRPAAAGLRRDSLRSRLTTRAKTGGKGITLPLVHPIMLPLLLGLQIFFAERAARCRLQILFKGFCLLRIREGNIGFERPRSPLSSVGNGAAIVISNPLTEIP